MFTKQLLSDLTWDLSFKIRKYSIKNNTAVCVIKKGHLFMDINPKYEFDLIKSITILKTLAPQNYCIIKTLKKSKIKNSTAKKFRIQSFLSANFLFFFIEKIYKNLIKEAKKFHTFAKFINNWYVGSIVFDNLGELPMFEELKYDYFSWQKPLKISFICSTPSRVVFSKLGLVL